MQNLTLRWFLRGASRDGGGGVSICWVGLIVKNGSLLLVFGLGNNLGIKATYSGISLVSWLEWKDSERHSHETRHKTRTQTWTRASYSWNRSPSYTQTYKHMLELFSQVFVSRCVDLQAVACFSHVWVFVWRTVGCRYRHMLLVFITLNILLVPTCSCPRAYLVEESFSKCLLCTGIFFPLTFSFPCF